MMMGVGGSPGPLDLGQVEILCTTLFTTTDAGARASAEAGLAFLRAGGSSEALARLKGVLEATGNAYAGLYAATSVFDMVTGAWQSLGVGERAQLRTYLLTLLFERGPEMQSFVADKVTQCLARVIKFGWFDGDGGAKGGPGGGEAGAGPPKAAGAGAAGVGGEEGRQVVKQVQHFLAQNTVKHIYLGLRLLQLVVQEMNQPNPGRSLTQHRKSAVSFRDLCLLDAFKLALGSLRQLQSSPEERLQEVALGMTLLCLTYDFIGTSLDESTEDVGTIQVPASWRGVLEDDATVRVCFEYYLATGPPLSSVALECLVQLASVRRSLFSDEASRKRFLANLVGGTRDILRNQNGLEEHKNYHEFCRLLGRLKTNYQLSELVDTAGYAEWVELLAQFTLRSLQAWEWAGGSVYYLLGLWSRLVSSLPYLKGDSPSFLEEYVPRLTEGYISSRLESVASVLASHTGGGVPTEDPLDNDEQLQEQLENLPFLCRFKYARTSEYVLGVLEPIVAQYAACSSGTVPPGVSLELVEGQLTWLLYIVGSIVRGRTSSSAIESSEAIDGEMSARAFHVVQLMGENAHAQRYASPSKQRLEMAALSFFQFFRKVFIGEQATSASALYARLRERLNLHDHLGVLDVMVQKVASNLKYYAASDQVVTASLLLFQELASGYMSGKLLLKLDSVKFVLSNHTREHFAFLDQPANMRNRTVFYTTLGRLLFMDDSRQKFDAFMAPLARTFDRIKQAAEAGPAAFRADDCRAALIGGLRDLRGVVSSTNSRRTYGLLFDFVYPEYFPVLHAAAEAYYDCPDVTTPLLKFIAEFVLNKTQRLTFDCSSANGILLFREVSKLLCTYGTRLMANAPAGPQGAYALRYKGIWICLSILSRTLGGNYVNFGVFELYGDPALQDALEVCTRLALSIPVPDIVAYKKVAKAYYQLIDSLASSHTAVLLLKDTATFAHIMGSVQLGLKSIETSISSQCASAIDSIVSFFYTAMQKRKADAAAQRMEAHLQQCPRLLPETLQTLFEIVLFEECANQWSLSRPMLSLILLNEQHFDEIKRGLVESQPQIERRARLTACFDTLMKEVDRTLEPRNRDRFTQNLTLFRHAFRTTS